jgi:hypothetical protein
MTTRSIQDMDKLMKKLDRLENPVKPVAKGMENYMGFLENKIKPYPPHSQANVSPGVNGYSWYVRGYGTRTVTGKAYKTSEKMDKRWSFKIRKMASVVRITITNTASYSIFVQGLRQTWYHAKRGWKRVGKVVDATSHIGLRYIAKEIERELNR